jgi:sugar lactone lactonase YvrE
MKRAKVWSSLRLTLLLAAGCGGRTSDSLTTVSSALDATSVLGFESATQWSATAGTLSTSTTHDQGAKSVALSAGISYVEVSNAPAPLPTLSGITATVAYDIRLASTVAWGYAALSINSPQAGIYNDWISQVSLVGVPAGTFQTVSFMLPSTVVTALAKTYSDLTFKVILNIPPTTGLTDLDNLRFVSGAALLAKTVFGHPDFTTVVPNEVVSNRVFNPAGVFVDRSATPNRVYVFDSGNMRVLGFDSLGTCSGGSAPGTACTDDLDCPGSGAACSITGTKAPKLIFGQKDGQSATCNGDSTDTLPASASTLCPLPYPRAISLLESAEANSIATDSAHNLYVPDKWNHRILKYNDPFSTNDTTADFVWGQPDFASRQCNQDLGAPTASTLCLNDETTGIHVSGNETGTGVDVDSQGNVWVTDVANNRVLRFPSNSKTANLVLGQSTFTSGASDPTECASTGPSTGQHLCWPKVVRYNATTNQVYVVDWRGGDSIVGTSANASFRVLIYNAPFSNGMSASDILVGSDFGTINTSLQRWRRPTGLEIPAGSTNAFWLSDSKHSRLLYYTKASGSWQATKVLSQANLTDVYEIGVNCGGGSVPNDQCLAAEPDGSFGLDSAGNLYTTDIDEMKMMRFPTNTLPNAPLASGTGAAMPANAILFPAPAGSGVFVNQVSAKGLYSIGSTALIKYPAGTTPATQLVVADQFRVPFWNGYATRASGDPADGVLYQASSSTQIPSSQGALQTVVANSTGSKIFVAGQAQIDVFKGPLTLNQAPFASLPLTLPFRLGGNTGAMAVEGLAYDETNDVLWIADHTGHRVLRLPAPLGANPTVNLVLGQPSATSLNPNRGLDDEQANNMACPSVQPDGFGNMSGVHIDKQGNLYVMDGTHEGWQCSNDRALEYDASALLPAAGQDFFCGVMDSGCTTYRRPTRVYGPADFVHKDQSEGGPTNTPNTPISVAFDASNHMMMTVDGYGNPLDKRVFFYANPVPTCGNPSAGCAVGPTKILPLPAAQPTDAAFDPDGNLVVSDQTWPRVTFFAGADVAAWMSAP